MVVLHCGLVCRFVTTEHRRLATTAAAAAAGFVAGHRGFGRTLGRALVADGCGFGSLVAEGRRGDGAAAGTVADLRGSLETEEVRGRGGIGAEVSAAVKGGAVELPLLHDVRQLLGDLVVGSFRCPLFLGRLGFTNSLVLLGLFHLCHGPQLLREPYDLLGQEYLGGRVELLVVRGSAFAGPSFQGEGQIGHLENDILRSVRALGAAAADTATGRRTVGYERHGLVGVAPLQVGVFHPVGTVRVLPPSLHEQT